MTIITPSVPSRRDLLAEATESVAAQTVAVQHLIDDDPKRSVADKRNRMISAASTDWVAFLDDDDILDPIHVETLLGGEADVVIPHCRFLGPPLPAIDCCPGYYNRPFDREDLRQHGIFPITVLARREAILGAGGFGDGKYEDWDLWNAMADAGATFEVVPVVTWTYRRTGMGRSRRRLWRQAELLSAAIRRVRSVPPS